ncbi:hypothetical protein [Saccharospirillum mangrovi]|uniref:hypothetical protein n=1 Tax=Saccharospirillum mangrovi TaxID=2161747 RepID=UPI000D39488F|nr:hypothetical protein [Saccharospirillum mangrovi]
MTTLFSHFLAQVLGCANLGNLHNRVRTRLMFQPDHGLSAAQVDDFLLNGSGDEHQLAFWSELLSIDLDLLRDAAHLAQRSAELQQQRLPRLEVNSVGTLENLAPARHVRVSVRIAPGEHPQPERLANLGERWLQRDTGYTVADLNEAGAFDRILAVANQHWQSVEQLTGAPADAIEIDLMPQAG